MLKKLLPLWRGLAAIMLSLVLLFSIGYTIADTWRGQVDAAFGTSSYVTDTSNMKYTSTYQTGEEMMEAAKAFAVREGEEGTVLMKNENNALPLAEGATVALFGGAAYSPYMSAAGNEDQVKLESALTNAGFKIDSTMKGIYEKLFTVKDADGNDKYTPNTRAGDYTDFKIKEANPSVYTTDGGASAGWQDEVTADVALVVFSRPGGEGTTYKPGSALDTEGNATGKDPLDLSDDEIAVVDAAKETCDTVIVLLNTSCTIEIGELKAGEHAVDGIVYIGIPNDYQFTGIVNVLAGKANATGALADTYATSSVSSPAMMNFGGGYYADYEIVSDFEDTRWPGEEIGNEVGGSFGGTATYSGGFYIVEAEGIYTGYNYYETRYYDSIANSSFNADSAKGSTQGGGWDYDKEVSYTFGHGLSYIPYTQRITAISVEDKVGGYITATVEVTNEGEQDGLFLAQLYVQQPYTEYDRDNLVEKSAVMFLNSKKAEVGANETVEVEITVPSKYLASYDYTNAKTYILDEGDYLFTAANGAHEAVNNFLAAQGFDTADGMDANGEGDVVTWTLNSFDDTTFATANGHEVTNVADNADMNYWLPGTVTYLSRADWEGTYPVNYNYEADGETINQDIDLNKSSKKDEWIKEIRGMQYTIDNTGAEVSNVDGADLGYKFNSSAIPAGAYEDINHEYWDNLVAQISVNEALGAVIHGGGQSDTLTYVDNPVVGQNEGVNGIKGTPTTDNPNVSEDEVNYHYNVNSQTLMGSSFNPDLAYEWGVLQGDAGIWLQKYAVWGTGLTLRRTPYNGRNYEYISEDPMLTNRIGYGILKGTADMGLVCGPKHIGFNDQEHNRSGIAVYMNEQKFRQTDLRGFEGGLCEGGGLAVMVAFNRIGATNASHHVGMLKDILREERGFTGVISTDLANNAKYFNAEAMIMATVTQRAEFGGNNSYLSESNNHSEGDKTYTYISVDSTKNDAVLVNQAREDLKYQLYTFANSQVVNVRTKSVTPPWESALNGIIIATGILSGAAVILWLASSFINDKKEVK